MCRIKNIAALCGTGRVCGHLSKATSAPFPGLHFHIAWGTSAQPEHTVTAVMCKPRRACLIRTDTTDTRPSERQPNETRRTIHNRFPSNSVQTLSVLPLPSSARMHVWRRQAHAVLIRRNILGPWGLGTHKLTRAGNLTQYPIAGVCR